MWCHLGKLGLWSKLCFPRSVLFIYMYLYSYNYFLNYAKRQNSVFCKCGYKPKKSWLWSNPAQNVRHLIRDCSFYPSISRVFQDAIANSFGCNPYITLAMFDISLNRLNKSRPILSKSGKPELLYVAEYFIRCLLFVWLRIYWRSGVDCI